MFHIIQLRFLSACVFVPIHIHYSVFFLQNARKIGIFSILVTLHVSSGIHMKRKCFEILLFLLLLVFLLFSTSCIELCESNWVCFDFVLHNVGKRSHRQCMSISYRATTGHDNIYLRNFVVSVFVFS